MRKEGYLVVLILCIMLLICGLFACDKNDDFDTETLFLNEKGFNYNTSLNALTWDCVEGATYYKVLVYPTYNSSLCIYSNTIEPISINALCILGPEIMSYPTVVCYVTAYSEDYSIISNTVEYILDFTPPEEETTIDAPTIESGVLEGFEDGKYYYVGYSNNMSISKLSTLNYAIILDKEEGIASVSAPGLTTSCYTYNETDKMLIIKNSYIKQFSVGAKIPFTITYNDEQTNKTYLCVKSYMPNTLGSSSITFSKQDTTSMKYVDILDYSSSTTVSTFVLDDIVVDGTIAKQDNSRIGLNASGISRLTVGEHNLKVYFVSKGVELGYSELTIIITTNSKSPYNFYIDFDSNYPDIYAKWDIDTAWDRAELEIDGTTYSSESCELFENNTFKITGKVMLAGDVAKLTLYKDNIKVANAITTSLEQSLNDTTAVSYLNNQFEYLGATNNMYISSQKELNELTAYNIISYPDDDNFRTTSTSVVETYKIYAPWLASLGSQSAILNKINESYKAFLEPRYVVINAEDITISGNVISYVVAQKSGGTRPYTTYHAYSGTSQYTEYAYNEKLHYYTNGESTRSATFEGFKVNDIESTCSVDTSVELFLALEAGLLPVPTTGSSAANVYNKAKNVLRSILDDNMTDYEKVLAIYDWMAYNVIYDRGLSSAISMIDLDVYASYYKNTSFFAEGVFNYGVALCNGIAMAFSILCNIEGIPCYKIMGSVSSGDHSWNKVKVDGEWYICDPTMASAKNEDEKKEYITYDYFMQSTKESIGDINHRTEKSQFDSSTKYKALDGQYNYWASEFFVYNGVVYDCIIDSIDEFKILIEYYTQTSKYYEMRESDDTKVIRFSIKANGTYIEAWFDSFETEYQPWESRFNISYFSRDSFQTTYLTIEVRE